MSLSLQDVFEKFSPLTHVPCQSAGTGIPVLPANDGFSGQMPVSITPTTIPAPAFAPPPSCDQIPPAAFRPRKLGVSVVSGFEMRSGSRRTTPGVLARRSAWLADSFTATPLFVIV